MKTRALLISLLALSLQYHVTSAQVILNGDFENNTSPTTCNYNLSNAAFNALMSDVFAFGTGQEIDIMSNCLPYCPSAQSGNWYIALANSTGASPDALSLTLSTPLIAGNTYTLSFWDHGSSFTPTPIQIGVSTVNDAIGTVVYTAPAPTVGVWTQRIATFVAPNNGMYLTVSATTLQWTQVDHFEFLNLVLPVLVSASNDTSICEGACTNIMATASSGTPPYSYSWTPNIGSGAGPFSVCPSATTTYVVSVTDSLGSAASDSVTVTVNSLPPANLFPNGTLAICNGTGILLNANAGDYHYTWYQDGVVVQNGINSSYMANSPGVYQVQVSDLGSGCSSMSQTATIVLGGGPVATIVTAGGCGSVLYNGGSVTLTGTATNAVSYLWSPGGQTTASIQVTQPGTYCVTAYDAAGCPSDVPACTTVSSANVTCGQHGQKVILCHVPPGNPGNPQTLCIAPSAVPAHLANHPGDCLGPCSLYYPRLSSDEITEEMDYSFYMDAYPNPFQGTFSLELINSSTEPVNLSIYDMIGRVVESYSNVNEKTQIGAHLKAGVYFIVATQGDNMTRLRIVKE